MITLEHTFEFKTLAELFAWRLKHARHMFLVGEGGVYHLIPTKTAWKSASERTSRPFLAQKSK